MFYVSLQNFLLYYTGSKETIGNNITVAFSESDSVAVSVNTCTRTTAVSMRIKPEYALKDELASLIKSGGLPCLNKQLINMCDLV